MTFGVRIFMTQILFIAVHFTTCIVISLLSFLFHSFTPFPLVLLSSFFFPHGLFPSFVCLFFCPTHHSFILSFSQSLWLFVKQSVSYWVSLSVIKSVCQLICLSVSFSVCLFFWIFFMIIAAPFPKMCGCSSRYYTESGSCWAGENKRKVWQRQR